jgi:hypothetical protein
MVRDLKPASLFLAELNRASAASVQSRYFIVRGQALSTRKTLLLALGIGTARAGLRSLAESSIEGSRRHSVATWISQLRLPEEVRTGDLAVTLTSATTQNPAEVLTVSNTHTDLPDDDQVIRFVSKTIQQ